MHFTRILTHSQTPLAGISVRLFPPSNLLLKQICSAVFIYSCPSASPVRQRMIYSAGFLSTYRAGKVVFGDLGDTLIERKIETSDPKELNEEFLKFELGFGSSTSSDGAAAPAPGEDKKAFARPKGPGRKR